MSGIEKKNISRVPGWATTLHAVAMIGGFTLYCGMMYVLVRPLFGSFGFEIGFTLKSMAVVSVLGCFVFFLMPIVDLPLIWFHHRRPEVRARRGCCPDCGHPKPPETSGSICSECGSEGIMPSVWQPGIGTIRRFLVLLAVSILLGSALGEWALLIDERNFEGEATLRTYPVAGDSYSRARAWPNGHASMTYTPENGPSGSTFMESTRIRRWQREGD
jgi:hypothetical protein